MGTLDRAGLKAMIEEATVDARTEDGRPSLNDLIERSAQLKAELVASRRATASTGG